MPCTVVDEQLSYTAEKHEPQRQRGRAKERESEGKNRKEKVREKDNDSEMERGLCHSAPESERRTEGEKGRSSRCF